MAESYSLKIVDSLTGRLVEAEMFDQIQASNILDYENGWRPLLEGRARLGGLPVASAVARPGDQHWDWASKLQRTEGNLSFRHFALEAESMTQGLMQIELTHRSRVGNQHIVYIDFIAVAPWNRVKFTTTPRFRGIGSVLLKQAVGTSYDEGFHGRVGLHSLASASGWYRDKLNMTSYGVDEHYEELEYFEFDEHQAAEFMQQMN